MLSVSSRVHARLHLLTRSYSKRKHASPASRFIHEPTYTPSNPNLANDGLVPHKRRALPRRLDTVRYDDSTCAFYWSTSQPKVPRPSTFITRVHGAPKSVVVDAALGSAVFGHPRKTVGNHWLR